MPSFTKKAAPERSLSQNDPHWTQKNHPKPTTDTLPTNPSKYTFLPTITARQFKFKIFDQDHCKIIDQKCFLENIFFAKSVPSKRDKKMVNFGTFLYQ